MRTDAYPDELSHATIAAQLSEDPSLAVEYFGRSPIPVDPPEKRPFEEVLNETVENLHLIEAGIVIRLEDAGLAEHIATVDYRSCTTLKELADRMHEVGRDFIMQELAGLSEEGYQAAILYADEALWILQKEGWSEQKTVAEKFDATLEFAMRGYRCGAGTMLGEARQHGMTDPEEFLAVAERSSPVLTFVASHSPLAARLLLDRMRVQPMVRLEGVGERARFVITEERGDAGVCPGLWSGLIPRLWGVYLETAHRDGHIERALSRVPSV